MASTRTRNFNLAIQGQSQSCTSGVCSDPSTFSQTVHTGTVTDTIGDYGGAHGFTLSEIDAEGFHPIFGEITTGVSRGTYIRNAIGSAYTGTSHVIIASKPPPSAGTMAAKTSISRPDITPLSLLQDLYDIPRALRDVGKIAKKGKSGLSAKDIANQHLAIQFGWLPLIEDARKLLQTQARVEKRFKRLRHLYDNGGERRSYTFNTDSAESKSVFNTFNPPPLQVSVTQKISTSMRQWSTVRWKLLQRAPESRNYEEMHDLAWRMANGLTPRGMLEGAWDLLPWSWLVDWFTDASDFVLGATNSLPCSMSGTQFNMTKTESQVTWTRNPNSSPLTSGGDGVTTRKSLSRGVTFPSSFSATIPKLGVWEVSILGSLFVQRFQR